MYHQVTTPRTAAQKVLGTTELLEQVLLQLNQVQIFGVQRVSTKFKDVIDGSVALQERMLNAELFFVRRVSSHTLYSLHDKLNRLICIKMDYEWFKRVARKPTLVAKHGLRCEDKAASWTNIQLCASDVTYQLVFSAGVYSIHGSIVTSCTLRELVDLCWQGWERIETRRWNIIT